MFGLWLEHQYEKSWSQLNFLKWCIRWRSSIINYLFSRAFPVWQFINDCLASIGYRHIIDMKTAILNVPDDKPDSYPVPSAPNKWHQTFYQTLPQFKTTFESYYQNHQTNQNLQIPSYKHNSRQSLVAQTANTIRNTDTQSPELKLIKNNSKHQPICLE